MSARQRIEYRSSGGYNQHLSGKTAIAMIKLKDNVAYREILRRFTGRPLAVSKFAHRTVSAEFDTDYYLSQDPDLKARANRDRSFDPVAHYFLEGFVKGLDPHPKFNTKYYLDTNPDVAKSGQNPFFHYILHGRQEGRWPNSSPLTDEMNVGNFLYGDSDIMPASQLSSIAYELVKSHFEPSYYATSNSDIEDALNRGESIDLVSHYLERGFRENRDPTRSFSTQYYLSLNGDVRAAGVNPFYHYLSCGRGEGRSIKPFIDRKFPALPSAPRVLFVSHAAQNTGAEVVLRDMLEWYANNTCYTIDVLVLEYGSMVESFAKYANVYTLSNPRELITRTEFPFSAYSYDYIYLNTVVSGAFAPAYERFFSRKQIPLVMHVHEMRKVISHYDAELQAIRPYVTKYIAASTRVREDLVDYFHIPQDKISIFESFIKVSAGNVAEIAHYRSRARAELGISDNDFLIIGAGVTSERKGPDVFIDTVDLVVRNNPNSSVVGIWIGDGPDFHALRHWIYERGIDESIRFIGFRQNARELIAAADVFFLPSREDPFPLVALEAAQFAIPTLYFKGRTGIDAFTRDDAGLFISDFTADNAATAIQRLLSNRALLEELGLNARMRVVKCNSHHVIVPGIFHYLKQLFEVRPTLSVIVPNFNHENYLYERLGSIIQQGLHDMELIILDDASTDDSITVIENFLDDSRVSLHINETGSGSPFHQWKKGLGQSSGSIVWIAESDDTCSDNFLATLLRPFERVDLNISYCTTVNIDASGRVSRAALEDYMRYAGGDRYDRPYICKGSFEVESAMAFCCTLVNASSALMKKSALLNAVGIGSEFKMCGDWIIYLHMLRHGSISYSTEATNYFRRHAESVVSKVEGSDLYFEERAAVARFALDNFYLSSRTANRIVVEIEKEWQRFSHIPKKTAISAIVERISLRTPRNNMQDNLRSIGFYIHGLLFSRGGIERQGVEIANHLSRIGHDVTIFCRKWSEAEPVYPVDADVRVIPIFDENKVDTSTTRLREALVRSGVEIFVPMLSEDLFDPILDAAEGLRIATIASEHNDPWVIEQQWWSRTARQRCFSRVDIIHLLLEKFTDSIAIENRHKVRVIPNGIKLHPAQQMGTKLRHQRMIAVGRLVQQKNFAALVHAFARLQEYAPGWELHIFGDGPEREMLLSMIEEYGLSESVFLRGESNAIQEEMSISEVIVVPSLFEGFSIVVAESKAAGIPAVAYSSCNGPNELIRDNIDGLLCHTAAVDDKDGQQLSEVLRRLVEDAELRNKLAINAAADAVNYEFEIIFSKWEDMLLEASKCISHERTSKALDS